MIKHLKEKPQAVFFDWDGTLALTRDLVVSAMEKTLSFYGLPDWDTIKVEKRDTTKSLKENFPNFFGDNAVQAYEAYLKNYEDGFCVLKVPEGAKDVLTLLSAQDIALGFISNKEKSLLLKEVTHLFPNIEFLDIMGNGDAKHNKPHPAPILEITQAHNIDLGSIWMVGDTKQDTECAYEAGCSPILIGEGKFMNSEYIQEKKKANPPLVTFSNFQEFYRWLLLEEQA